MFNSQNPDAKHWGFVFDKSKIDEQ